MGVIGALLFLLAVIGLILGLIRPSLAIWWGTNKTRGKVFVTYGLALVVAIVLTVVGAPSNLEAGKTALNGKNYNDAAKYLSEVEKSDPGYAEAQRLLPTARHELLMSKLEGAEVASLAGDHAKVVELLSDYPTQGAGSMDAAKMLDESKDALASLAQESESKAAVKAADRQAQKARDAAEENANRAARMQAKAMKDFPECASDEAETELVSVLEHAPLGRVYGLSLIKLTDAKEVGTTPTSRSCSGLAQLNNASKHPMTYRFYRDGDDVMVEAEVLGLDE